MENHNHYPNRNNQFQNYAYSQYQQQWPNPSNMTTAQRGNYPNQQNQFQNYAYSQYQQQLPSPFNMTTAQRGSFPVNTSIPFYNQAQWSQGQDSCMPSERVTPSEEITAHPYVRPQGQNFSMPAERLGPSKQTTAHPFDRSQGQNFGLPNERGTLSKETIAHPYVRPQGQNFGMPAERVGPSKETTTPPYFRPQDRPQGKNFGIPAERVGPSKQTTAHPFDRPQGQNFGKPAERVGPSKQTTAYPFDRPQGQNFGMPTERVTAAKDTTAYPYVRPQGQNFGKPSEGLAPSRETTAHQDVRPPPSYEESSRDALLSSSVKRNRTKKYTNERGGRNQQTEKRSFSFLFDYHPEKNFVTSECLESSNSFSQQPSSSQYRGQSEFMFTHNNVSEGRESNYLEQSNKRGFGKQAGFRGCGNLENNNRFSSSLSWQENPNLHAENNQTDRNSIVDGTESASEDYGESGDIVQSIPETEEQDQGNEEGNFTKKVNVFVPSPDTVKKYQYYPPSPEEMGNMFKDLVIYYFFKGQKNRKENNPFVVVCESFRRSKGYSDVEVEDGYDIKFKDRKFCTIRYNNMMLVRGVGDNNCLKEPRVRAAVELINKLAMSCYTLEANPEYYSVAAFERQLENGDVPGVYCIVPPEKASNFESACTYLRPFMYDDSDIEHMFYFKNQAHCNSLRSWANKCSDVFGARVIKDNWLGVYKRRSPQYWRDKILASGSMQNPKYILKPPQGIGNLLIPNFNIKDFISQLRVRPSVETSLVHVYGPPGVGPDIRRAIPPWRRFNHRKLQKPKDQAKHKKNLKNQTKQVMKFLKQGVPLNEINTFKNLNKNKKKKIRQKIFFANRNK